MLCPQPPAQIPPAPQPHSPLPFPSSFSCCSLNTSQPLSIPPADRGLEPNPGHVP